jgi:hypothetical protein
VITGFFHVGIVVPELGEAMRGLSGTLGLSWTRIDVAEMAYELDGRSGVRRIHYVYSEQGPPYIELIEQHLPLFDAVAGIHHAGVWSEDIVADIEALGAQGFVQGARTQAADDDPPGFCYLADPVGPLVELVNSRTRRNFEEWHRRSRSRA